MADEFLPPVVASLLADIAPYVAGLTEAQARMDLFVEAQTVAMAKVDSRMAAMGAGGGGMGAGMRAEATAASAAATDVVAANDRIALSAAKTAESGTLAAMQWEVDYERMARATTTATLEMEAAQRQAAASTEAMATKIDAAAASSAATTAGKMKLVKDAAAGIGLVGGAVAAVSVKMAADFETATNKLVTSAGETEQGLQVVRQGMLALAGEVGVSAIQLAKDIYPIGSAGYHAEAGLAVLKAAEQGAKAEGAEGIKVADALSSALRDYYPHAQSAADVTKASADVMSKFIGATSAGKMSFDDLARSLNNVLPFSSAANISLTDTLGVLASMTVHGISAQQATENMTDAIRHLQAPTAVMSKAMATLGLDSIDVAAKLGERGLSGTMQLLSERVKAAMPPGSDKVILQLGDALSKSTPKVQELGQKLLDGSISMAGFSKEAKALDPLSAKQAASFSTLAGSYHQLGTQQISGAEVMQSYGGMMQKVMGDATGLKVALMTTGENAGYTNDAIKTISGSTADASGNVKGWSEVQNTFNQHLSQAKAALGALAIEVGTKLLPVVSKIAGVFADVVGWLAKHKVAAEILAGVVGGALVVAFSALLAVFWGFAANPVTWIIAGIVVALLAVGTAVYLLITHWSAVERFLSGAWSGFVNWGKGLWQGFVGFFVDVWRPIAGFFTGIWNAVSGAVTAAWNGIGNFLMATWRSLVATTKPIWEPIIGIIKDIFQIVWDIIRIVVYGIAIFVKAEWEALVAIAKVIWTPLSRFFSDVWNAVATVFRIAWDEVSRVLRSAWDAYMAYMHWFWDPIAGMFRDIWNAVVGVFRWAWDLISLSVSDGINKVNNFVGGIGQGILDALGDVGNLLWNAGVFIINGFLRGLQAAFNDVKNFVGGIANWVQAHKGPLDKDAVLLTPAGNAIMGGLLAGLQQGGGQVQSYLDKFTTGISTGATIGITGRVPGAVSGGASSGMTVVNTHVHVNVEGSVHSVTSLRAAVQDAVLQHKFRNATNGLG